LEKILSGEIKSQNWRRAFARSRVIVSNVTTDQFGISGAAIDWALNLNPSSISKIILCERNDPALKDGFTMRSIIFHDPCFK